MLCDRVNVPGKPRPPVSILPSVPCSPFPSELATTPEFVCLFASFSSSRVPRRGYLSLSLNRPLIWLLLGEKINWISLTRLVLEGCSRKTRCWLDQNSSSSNYIIFEYGIAQLDVLASDRRESLNIINHCLQCSDASCYGWILSFDLSNRVHLSSTV